MRNVLIPDDVYGRLEELAAVDHVSVDRLVVAMVNERVGEWSRLQERAARGSIDKLKRVLAKVSDAPPVEADRI